MFRDLESAFQRDLLLAFFNFLVKELFDLSAIEANQMVVMRSLVELEDRLAGLEMIAVQYSGLLELRQHTVHGRQTDIHIFGQQDFIYVFRAQVAYRAILKNFEDLESRQRRFQAAGFQIGGVVGHVLGRIWLICFII